MAPQRKRPTPVGGTPAGYFEARGELAGKNSAPRRLPPFGKPLADALRAGRVPANDIRLYIGVDAWTAAERHTASAPKLVLPPGEPPDSFSWPVQGCSVWVIQAGDASDHQLLTLTQTLLDAGAEVVRVSQGIDLAVFRGGGHGAN